MKWVIALAPLAVMAACATPQEQCLSNATQDLRINAFLIAQTEANLERGFAVDQQQRVTRRPTFCRTEDNGFRFGCTDVRVRNVAVPQAINLETERDTLDQLLATRAQLQRRTDAAVAECRRMFPA
ncbi:hypothetical protein SAMN05428995_102329 [Loktanella sp. DSM 29012]|uniref:Excinuclease ABC subunit B n=1 Tax=Loktanella gaetbuli TaxID=2881335 RepID=A0ABS8BVD3_9RHOB|nr:MULTISPECIES: hypothetical protein [Loktanella]MCB5199642.1 hypothetical protein [Loktanella gaetbuli]SEQ01895.1 hypothetical protein SAMN05428995_102329 [Loktanella sp. DSM 29012]